METYSPTYSTAEPNLIELLLIFKSDEELTILTRQDEMPISRIPPGTITTKFTIYNY